MPQIETSEEGKFQEFISYLEKTWIGTGPGRDIRLRTNATFDRIVWNLYENISHRTNNISESYNKRINGQVNKPDPTDMHLDFL